MKPALTLGVLGISPAATLGFLEKVHAFTPGAAERDQIRVIVDINPKLPDLATPGSGAGAALAEAAGALRGAGADVLAIASDAAHAHLALIERASGLAVVDMIGTTAKALREAGAVRVGVLGPRGAVRLYREYLAAQAMGLVALEPERQQGFAAALEAVRDGDSSPQRRAELRAYANELAIHGAEAIVAGAVELPDLLEPAGLKAPLIDPAELLAGRCVAVCLGLEPAPTILR